MSQSVPVHHVQQHKANVEHLLQQMPTRLRGAVTSKGDYRGKLIQFIDQIGAVAVKKRTDRHADVVPVNTPADRRWFVPDDYEVAELVDDQDKLRMLFDPTGHYAESFRFAHNRKIDEVILDAMFGAALTGENGTTSTAFDTANQQIAAGGSGLTVGKLITAREILRRNEVDDNDPMFCALRASEETDLLNEIEVVNTQWAGMERPVMKSGKLESFLGFTFLHTELIRVDGSANGRIPAWVKSGMHLGLLKDVTVDVGPRRDKGATIQVYTCATYGASRTNEKKVVEILCA
jgi:hypothetical protein